MNKNLFFVALAAAALASCSQNEIVEMNNGQAIGFRTAMGNRAVETTLSNLEEFYVTAIDTKKQTYFENAEFSKKSVNSETGVGNYSSEPIFYYWPITGGLTFHAYAPAGMTNKGLSIDATSATASVNGFVPESKFKNQVDFIYETATGDKSDEGTGVALIFDHLLTQIEVQAKNGNEGYIYTVRGVCLGNIGSKGSLATMDGAWTIDQENEANVIATYSATYGAIELGETEKTLMADVKDKTETAMLIPQDLTGWDFDATNPSTDKGAWIGVLINIKTKDGAEVYPGEAGKYAWTAIPIDTDWQAGNKYTYILDFSKGAGYVAPNQPNADDDSDDDNDDDEEDSDDKPEITKPDEAEPGEEILGGGENGIFFTVVVSKINNTDTPVDMKKD